MRYSKRAGTAGEGLAGAGERRPGQRIKGSSPPECRFFGAAERKQGWAPKGFAKQTRRAARRAVLLGALAGDGAATRLVGRSGLLPRRPPSWSRTWRDHRGDLRKVYVQTRPGYKPRALPFLAAMIGDCIRIFLRLASTATHIYAAPLHVGSEQALLEPPPGVVGTDKTGAMQDPASGLPRIFVPRTPMNKGKKRAGALRPGLFSSRARQPV